ncbi:MAG: hypothetical protein JWO50_17 [Candidatus Kaiserbacteria bacterium]|nr:hypothetical protein [Candidatus Kaiserbacteria bacterium]
MQPSSVDTTNYQATSTLPAQMVNVATSTDYTVVSGSYPQFADLPADFNKKIVDAVQAAIVDNVSASQENWQARVDTATPSDPVSKIPSADERFSLDFKTEIIRNDSNVVSVLLTIGGFSGGAHGFENLLSFNYDRAHKHEITIKSLENNDSNFLNKLSTISRTMLAKDLAQRANVSVNDIDQGMLNDGTQPKEENFSVFTLPNDHQVTFYFTQYQVAAYVFGDSRITVDLPLK